MRAGASRLAGALLGLLLLAPGVGAQDSSPRPEPLVIQAAEDPAAASVRRRGLEIDVAEGQLARARLTDEELAELRARLLDLREAAQAEREAAEVAAVGARRLLDVLGPPPAANAPPEAEGVAAERRRLAAEVARHDGLGRQAELAATRAQELLGRIGLRRREQLLSELLRRGDSPLDPQEWIGAWHDLPRRIEQRRQDWRDWWASPARTEGFARALRIALLRATLAGALLVALGWYLRRRFGRKGRAVAPAYHARVLAAVADAVLFVAAPVGVILAFSGTMIWSGALAPQLVAVTRGWSGALCALLVGIVGARLLLRPRLPGWRTVPLGNGSARRLTRNVALIAVLIALEVVAKPGLFGATSGFGEPDIRTVYDAVTTIAFGLAFALLARAGNWKPGGEIATIGAGPAPEVRAAHAERWRLLRLIWLVAVVAAMFAALTGYARLGGFILSDLFFSAVIVGVLVLAHLGVREAMRLLTQPALAKRGGEVFTWWALRLADAALVLFGVLAILPVWGVGLDEIGDLAWRSLHGMRIGGYNISLLGLLAAVALFFAIRFVTKLVQRAFERNVVPQTRLDPGVANSVRAGIGYVGLALALVAAMGATGLDLTNIALVAGALSVGIGFGLQNIVNNFVSGIILLVERPIKVGDWVVVGQHEGTVRRINVRATEIETFRRSTVIIPNAEFLSSSVTNWTYSDRFGRVEVRVGVAWDADVPAVERLLLDCARSDPRILSNPAPHVLLNFGATALEFELRAVLADASTMAFVASDLRKKILAALGDAGIAIPLPVLDVHVRRPAASAT